MPPQQPSASWRAMIHSVQRRRAARRAPAGNRFSALCSSLSSPLNASDQVQSANAMAPVVKQLQQRHRVIDHPRHADFEPVRVLA